MLRLKIVADDKIPFLQGVLEPFADIIYLPGSKINGDDLKDAAVLFTRTRTQCDANLLHGSTIKLIATATIGYDHIDTVFCEKNGIHWTNAPGCNSSSVQQYVITALLSLAHDRNWVLKDITIGVIGVGNVGRKVAQAASALGMNVLLNDPPRQDQEGGNLFISLYDLLEQSDIVTCHTPLIKSGPYPTWHLANLAFFERMKNGAVFINTSRGEVVDTTALIKVMNSKISDIILDVWEGEPNIDPSLLQMAAIATPHIAGYSVDGKANGTAACVQQLMMFFNQQFLPKDWKPENIPPSPFDQYIEIDCSAKTAQDIAYHCMRHTYPIEIDSQKLKESPHLFEKQRADYWSRREPGYYVLKLTNRQNTILQPEVEETINALGFNRAH